MNPHALQYTSKYTVFRLMMAPRGVHTLLLALLWTTFSSSTLGIHLHKARIRVKSENAEFLSFNTSSGHMIDNLKLIRDPHSVNIYAGSPQGLYMLNPGEHPAVKQVHVPIFEPECKSNPTDCEYKITLLKEGRNGNPLFMCGSRREDTECCDVSSEHLPVNCSILWHPAQIDDPSLHVGDSLYYTVSDGSDGKSSKGLYRWTTDGITWTYLRQTEHRYVKILANEGNGSLDGKVYSFFIEQNQDPDSDMTLWIPRVSQICMADRGGSKSILQYRWTSMLTARMFCGDEKKRISYTELLDVAVLEDADWKNTTIYALFKNAYNTRAVCVYKMSDIIRVFTSNTFKDESERFSSPRPGECVEDSRTLSPSFLKFMTRHPELKQWIKPARDPLLFNHHHYTLLQVDRVKSKRSENSHHNVLLMSLNNGNVHKVLEQDGDPFIIAEYEPFKTRTHISSMLLDSTTKKLYVSSISEVIQIDLQDCSVYGKHCASCVMARDPYCGWDLDLETCSANTGALQDVTHGNYSLCENGVLKINESRTNSNSPSSVPRDSKFYLSCPMESQYASYVWDHRGRIRECVLTEQDCLLLIDSMSEKDEGVYECVSSENGYDRTIVRQELQMNAASETRMTRVALACLLFLISVIF
ncbi:semaphorin-7A-like [Ictalurus furcatus]|uniref:semaphorin-7A-like n=1 Tax=Ictalurus furcatus TaxID=66913 RepID=UPI002350B8F8|nr:semaphorin-7A-like [Ictalurus furcatus]